MSGVTEIGRLSNATPPTAWPLVASTVAGMSDEIRNAIEETAKGPKRVRTDAGEVESQDIEQQIAADKYLAAKAAMSRTNRGLRMNKLLPPGTY